MTVLSKNTIEMLTSRKIANFFISSSTCPGLKTRSTGMPLFLATNSRRATSAFFDL